MSEPETTLRRWCKDCRIDGAKGVVKLPDGSEYFDIPNCPNIEFHKQTDIRL